MKISLKALRVNANLNQSQAAKELGINPATLTSWESYKTFPDFAQLNRLCSLYSCTMDDIFVPECLAESEEV